MQLLQCCLAHHGFSAANKLVGIVCGTGTGCCLCHSGDLRLWFPNGFDIVIGIVRIVIIRKIGEIIIVRIRRRFLRRAELLEPFQFFLRLSHIVLGNGERRLFLRHIQCNGSHIIIQQRCALGNLVAFLDEDFLHHLAAAQNYILDIAGNHRAVHADAITPVVIHEVGDRCYGDLMLGCLPCTVIIRTACTTACQHCHAQDNRQNLFSLCHDASPSCSVSEKLPFSSLPSRMVTTRSA